MFPLYDDDERKEIPNCRVATLQKIIHIMMTIVVRILISILNEKKTEGGAFSFSTYNNPPKILLCLSIINNQQCNYANKSYYYN